MVCEGWLPVSTGRTPPTVTPMPTEEQCKSHLLFSIISMDEIEESIIFSLADRFRTICFGSVRHMEERRIHPFQSEKKALRFAPKIWTFDHCSDGGWFVQLSFLSRSVEANPLSEHQSNERIAQSRRWYEGETHSISSITKFHLVLDYLNNSFYFYQFKSNSLSFRTIASFSSAREKIDRNDWFYKWGGISRIATRRISSPIWFASISPSSKTVRSLPTFPWTNKTKQCHDLIQHRFV